MSYEQEFLQEFEAWVKTQVMINEMALKESQAVYEADQDEQAKEAAIRYESRLNAYQFLLGKFANYQAGKRFPWPARRTFGWEKLLIFHWKGDRISSSEVFCISLLYIQLP